MYALKHPFFVQHTQYHGGHLPGGHGHIFHDPFPGQKIGAARQIGGQQLRAVLIQILKCFQHLSFRKAIIDMGEDVHPVRIRIILEKELDQRGVF